MCVLDFGWYFASCFTLSQTLDFALRFTGELVRVFHAGLATQGYNSGTGSSSADEVATMHYSFHGRIFLI